MTFPARIMSENRLELPGELSALDRIANNLHWSWSGETRGLFGRIDLPTWIRSHNNPVRLLMEQSHSQLDALAADPGFVEAVRSRAEELDAYLAKRGEGSARRIAYFSAEFAIVECIRVYSGGLGVLAGDHLKSASDLGLPLAGVGLLYRDGYFTQQVDADGRQHEAYRHLEPDSLPLRREIGSDGEPITVAIEFPGRTVHARIWRADVGVVPLYLLDTDVESNSPADRHITDRLYGGDLEHRLEQELVLGVGGVRALAALGHEIDTYHLNEGHAAFVVVEQLIAAMRSTGSVDTALETVREQLVFTTHTPVEAGHDYFPPDLMHRYFGEIIERSGIPWDRFYGLGMTTEPHRAGQFCMTAIALRCARSSNGVSALHGRVSRSMWRDMFGALSVEDVPIGHVTNGVHLPTWVGPSMTRLYEEHVAADWRDRNGEVDWSGALDIPDHPLWQARREQRFRLIDHVRGILRVQAEARGTPDLGGNGLDPDALTITFARRFATYKRAVLLLSDIDRLAAIVGSIERPVQFIFAGKAHPKDEPGKDFIQQVFAASRLAAMRGRIVFVENYDAELARFLVQGSDMWLNLPRRPLEASGTSGMKSTANGGLNISVTDGWWAEAWEDHNSLEYPIGWAIDSEGMDASRQDEADAETLYRMLEQDIVPLFYQRDETGIPMAWLDRVRSAIAQVCPFFNTDRMVGEYATDIYRLRQTAAR
jgi:starch phosphorylase